MMRFTDSVPLAAIFKEHLRCFEAHIVESPQIGALTVDRTASHLIDRALGDLLNNAAPKGNQVRVRFAQRDGHVKLQVADDGPALPPHTLDDPSTNLYRLRRDVRHVGGDLEVVQGEGPGACLTFSVPIRIPPRYQFPRQSRSAIT